MLRWVFESIKYSERNAEVQKLLQENFQTVYQLKDDNGCTILHIVSDRNNLPLLSFILSLFDTKVQLAPKKNSWIDLTDEQGSTALHYAAFRGSLQAVQILESHGANCLAVNRMGLNCFHFAAQGGSPLLMYYFKEKGISINCTDTNGSTPLHWAAYTGMDYAVAALLSWGSYYDQQEMQGMTPLHLAVISGRVKITVRLLMAGCNRHIRNFKYQQPIDLADEKGDMRLVEILEDRNICCSEFTLRPQIGQPTKKRGLSFVMSIIIFTVTLFFNAFILYQSKNGLIIGLAISSLVMEFVAGICFIFLCCSNPGTIKVNTFNANNYLRLLSQNHPKNICFQCQIKKPRRSKHCYICSKCVMVFDHHCPWIGNCIGSNNTFIFTLSLGFGLIYNLITFTNHLLYIATLNYYSLSSFELGSLVISGLTLLLTILVVISVGYLLIRQIKLAGNGITFFQLYQRQMKHDKDQIKLQNRTKMMGQSFLQKKKSFNSTSQRPSNVQDFIERHLQHGENKFIGRDPDEASCLQNCQYIFYKNRYVREYGWQEQ